MLHPNDRIYNRIEPEDPVSSTEYLKQILDRYHIDPNDSVRQICSRWSDLAGSGLGEFSQCIGCEDGVLDVVCVHPAQIQLIRINKREIVKNINAAFPELDVKDLKVSVKRH